MGENTHSDYILENDIKGNFRSLKNKFAELVKKRIIRSSQLITGARYVESLYNASAPSKGS